MFYELLAGLTKDEKTTYGLQEEKNYYYLNQVKWFESAADASEYEQCDGIFGGDNIDQIGTDARMWSTQSGIRCRAIRILF